MTIIVMPAWYQTAWFRFLWAVCLCAVVWTVYQVRVHHLKEQEAKFREAVETIPVIAFITLPNGDRSFVNQRWVDYTGLAEEHALGSEWVNVIHPDDAGRVRERWRSALAAGQALDFEARYRGADGQYRWFQTRAVPVRDNQGRARKWCGATIDIEDRKRAEQLQTDLAHVNRISTMGELAASISHELKQPIAASILNAKTSMRWLKREPPDLEKALAPMEKIVQDGARASDIIDRVRALYKKSPSKRELLAVNDVIAEMAAMLLSVATECGVSLRTDLANDLPKALADRVQLQQVLMNLMLNSLEAMKNTGGMLTVLSRVSDDGQIEISVSDTGPGLPQGKNEQLFDAFFTTKPQGSGMGLAISRSIVESHGGRIWANGSEGLGATFHFSLPVAQKEDVDFAESRDSSITMTPKGPQRASEV